MPLTDWIFIFLPEKRPLGPGRSLVQCHPYGAVLADIRCGINWLTIVSYLGGICLAYYYIHRRRGKHSPSFSCLADGGVDGGGPAGILDANPAAVGEGEPYLVAAACVNRYLSDAVEEGAVDLYLLVKRGAAQGTGGAPYGTPACCLLPGWAAAGLGG